MPHLHPGVREPAGGLKEQSRGLAPGAAGWGIPPDTVLCLAAPQPPQSHGTSSSASGAACLCSSPLSCRAARLFLPVTSLSCRAARLFLPVASLSCRAARLFLPVTSLSCRAAPLSLPVTSTHPPPRPPQPAVQCFSS